MYNLLKLFEIPQKKCCRILDIRVTNIVYPNLLDAGLLADAHDLPVQIGLAVVEQAVVGLELLCECQ